MGSRESSRSSMGVGVGLGYAYPARTQWLQHVKWPSRLRSVAANPSSRPLEDLGLHRGEGGGGSRSLRGIFLEQFFHGLISFELQTVACCWLFDVSFWGKGGGHPISEPAHSDIRR